VCRTHLELLAEAAHCIPERRPRRRFFHAELVGHHLESPYLEKGVDDLPLTLGEACQCDQNAIETVVVIVVRLQNDVMRRPASHVRVMPTLTPGRHLRTASRDGEHPVVDQTTSGKGAEAAGD
jgi:hypothetical protein